MDRSLEQATMRRVAWRLIPFICLLYFIAFIDRVNIGNLGGFVGPWMIGRIKDRTGSFAGGLTFVAGLLLVSATLTHVVVRAGRRAEPAGIALR